MEQGHRRRKRAVLCGDGFHRGSEVEVISMLTHIGLYHVASMGIERIGEAVMANVAGFVGVGATLEKGNSQAVTGSVKAIFAIVQDGQTEAAIGQIRIFMSADLKTCKVSKCVLVDGSFNMTKLNIIGCIGGIDIDGIFSLYEQIVLIPIDVVVKSKLLRICVCNDIRADSGVTELAGDSKHTTERASLQNLYINNIVNNMVLLTIISLNIPVVIGTCNIIVSNDPTCDGASR